MLPEIRLKQSSCLIMLVIPVILSIITTGTIHSNDSGLPLMVALVWSADSNRIAVGTTDGVYIHDARTMHILDHINAGEPVSALDWSPNGRYIAVDTVDESVRLIDLERHTARDLIQHTSDISFIRWSPDGRFIASKSTDEIYVWDVSRQKLQFSIDGYLPLPALAWSPDSQTVATHLDSYMRVWDVLTGEQVYHWYDDIETSAIGWSPDGRILAAAGIGGTIRLFEPTVPGSQPVRIVKVNNYYVDALTWKIDSRQVAVRYWLDASKSTRAFVAIWDIVDGEPVSRFDGGNLVGGIEYGLVWSPDGTRLAVGADEGTITIWDTTLYIQTARYSGYKSAVDIMRGT